MRLPITEDSAVNLAKWRVGQIAKDPATPGFKRFALNAALNSGNIEEIIREVYALGFCLSADDANVLHKKMFDSGSIVKE